jgi:hypothetical protein
VNCDVPFHQTGRAPTEKQYELLRPLGSASAGLSWRKRDTEMLLRRGWVTADWKAPYYQWVRITPDGLRALAVAVEKYGLPDLSPKAETTRRICGDCGSSSYRYVPISAEQVMAGG